VELLAGIRFLLENGDLHTAARKRIRAGESGKTRPDDDAISGLRVHAALLFRKSGNST